MRRFNMNKAKKRSCGKSIEDVKKDKDRLAENFRINSPPEVTEKKDRQASIISWDRYLKDVGHIKENRKAREYVFRANGIPTETREKVEFIKKNGVKQTRTRDILTGRWIK
jgi:hypothetical protein